MASISDVALLEVVTKASGRPNGYRKVMKVWFCYYFGFAVCDRILGFNAGLAQVVFPVFFSGIQMFVSWSR